MMDRRRGLKRGTMMTSLIVVLQLLVTGFFLIDFAGDVADDGVGPHLLVEGLAAIGLLVGVTFGAREVRDLVQRARRDEAAVATARGAMTDLIRLRFADWKLTPAEADVAVFALKGCEIQDIATYRNAAQGTVRAQLTRIYAKSGVRSQAALMALFLEELVVVEPACDEKAD